MTQSILTQIQCCLNTISKNPVVWCDNTQPHHRVIYTAKLSLKFRGKVHVDFFFNESRIKSDAIVDLVILLGTPVFQ